MSQNRITEVIGDADWVTARLADGGVWPHGAVVAVRTERIGLGFGLSGEIHRVTCSTERGDVAVVAKFEPAAKIERALNIRSQVAGHLGPSIPALFGAATTDDGNTGVLLLEDIAPAEQGDELRPVSRRRAHDLVSIVAQLHRVAVPDEPRLERWVPRPVDPPGWTRALAGARTRYGGRFDHEFWGRIAGLGAEADDAASLLAVDGMVWVHRDPHLDNVLWRSDGSTVLLDWSNACVGPGELDLAVLLFSLSFAVEPAITPEEVIAMADRHASRVDRGDLKHVRAALTVHLRGVIGWTGLPDDPDDHPRKAVLRDDAIGRAHRALTWLDQTG